MLLAAVAIAVFAILALLFVFGIAVAAALHLVCAVWRLARRTRSLRRAP